MTDANSDGIWELTIPLNAGSYEYKFAADSWNIQENLTPGSSCTVTNFGFTNRTITVAEDVVLDPVCWASMCTNCNVVPASYDVTFPSRYEPSYSERTAFQKSMEHLMVFVEVVLK
jgi:hypothetical protein